MSLPGCSRPKVFESVWTVEARGRITSLWSVCDDQSNMKKCTYRPMTRSPKHELASLVTSSLITADGLIRVWLARRLITCTFSHSRNPKRLNQKEGAIHLSKGDEMFKEMGHLCSKKPSHLSFLFSYHHFK